MARQATWPPGGSGLLYGQGQCEEGQFSSRPPFFIDLEGGAWGLALGEPGVAPPGQEGLERPGVLPGDGGVQVVAERGGPGRLGLALLRRRGAAAALEVGLQAAAARNLGGSRSVCFLFLNQGGPYPRRGTPSVQT